MFKKMKNQIPIFTILFAILLCLNVAMLSVTITLSRVTDQLREDVSRVNESVMYLSDENTLVLKLFDLTKEDMEKELNKKPNQKMIKPTDLLDLGKKNGK
ncbi:hypothetical protein [Xenorhabdus sp. TH1]|uniref:hypothetical protein n=1 Tax=Xenorhabdus sp. TH1 TaxID=3130166 RepID=UPI0030CEF560